MEKDDVYQQQWLQELQKQAERRGATSARTIVSRAVRKLQGNTDQRQVGSHNGGMERQDYIVDAHDEAAAFIADTLLEIQKRNEQGRDGQHYLFEAALSAVMADYYLRMSKAA